VGDRRRDGGRLRQRLDEPDRGKRRRELSRDDVHRHERVGGVDLLAAGASVTAVLDANGTTTGHLLVPAAVTGTTAIDEDLTGTWTLANNQVTFNQSGGTFLRDVVFNVSGNTLVGNGAFSGTTLHLVLSK
jgi:hypothetical protein